MARDRFVGDRKESGNGRLGMEDMRFKLKEIFSANPDSGFDQYSPTI